MDSTLRRVPRQNVVRAKNRAISRRERLYWKRELNQEFSVDIRDALVKSENKGFTSELPTARPEPSECLE